MLMPAAMAERPLDCGGDHHGAERVPCDAGDTREQGARLVGTDLPPEVRDQARRAHRRLPAALPALNVARLFLARSSRAPPPPDAAAGASASGGDDPG
jgi:hypothetical protein